MSTADKLREGFEQQVARFESMLADLSGFEAPLDQAAIDRLAEIHEKHRKVTHRLERDLERLLNAWHNATGLSERERETIRELAHRAAALTQQITDEYHRTKDIVDMQAANVRDTLGQLARGRTLLKKYVQANRDESMFIDRKM